MSKRKKSKAKKGSNTLAYTAWALAFIAIALSSFVAGYYSGFGNAKNESVKKERTKEKKRLMLLQKLEDVSVKKASKKGSAATRILDRHVV